MDIEKEREAFEAVTSIHHCIYNADLNYYFSGSKFVGNKAEIEVNAGWKAWQAAKEHEANKLGQETLTHYRLQELIAIGVKAALDEREKE